MFQHLTVLAVVPFQPGSPGTPFCSIILFGHVRWLVGSQVADEVLNLDHCSESPES